jgi:3-isopropylmalate/(R)-2-methylmalate dehydratase small subunit
MKPRDYDYGSLLFCDLRSGPGSNGEFPINLPRYAGCSVVVAGANFGCGSAREQAAYAFWDYGVRAIFCSSVGDIFRRNCQKNGLLIGLIDPDDSAKLRAWIRETPGARLQVDLDAQVIVGGTGQRIVFTIAEADKAQLKSGLDDVSRTLQAEDDIAAFEARHAAAIPWLDHEMRPDIGGSGGARR